MLGVLNEVNNPEAIHLNKVDYSFPNLLTGDEAEVELEADGRAGVLTNTGDTERLFSRSASRRVLANFPAFQLGLWSSAY